MKYSTYYCPNCKYKFQYNASYEVCDCLRKLIYKRNSIYYKNSESLILIGANNYYYYLHFQDNKTQVFHNNNRIFVFKNLISQDYVNNFHNLINYL